MAGTLTESESHIFNSIADSLSIMSGINGSRVYGGTSLYSNVDIRAISVREDGTEFTSIVAESSGFPDLDASDFILGGATLQKGDLLVCPRGYRFTSFELSSGSIQGC